MNRIEGLQTAYWIREAYARESIGFIVHGPRGIGKSSYCVHVAADALVPYMDKPDYDAVFKWLIFTPQQFCEVILHTEDKRMVLVWDDAGYWINRLFWYERFVREALRYMTLARTQFAAILFNTPSLTMLPNKILHLPDVYRVKITKPRTMDKLRPNIRWRDASVKSVWFSDDLSKHGVRNEWEDQFSLYMPDPFFAKYEPLRKNYLHVAQELIREAAAKTYKDFDADLKERLLGKIIPEPETLDEVEEVNDQLL